MIQDSRFKIQGNGFSLIELLVGIAVLAAVVGTVGVNLLGYYRRQNLELTVQEIVVLLRDAQNRSLNQQDGNDDGQGDQWGLRFVNNTDEQDYARLFSGLTYETGTINSVYAFRNGVQLVEPVEGASKDIIFKKQSGLPTASDEVKISLTGSSEEISIIINDKGSIQY